jgi:mono/diheme cytochrome c family protein
LLQKVSTHSLKLALAAISAVLLCCASTAIAADQKNATKANSQSESSPKTTVNTPAAKPKISAPVALTAEQRGEKVFKKSYCAGCHAGGNNALMPDKPIKGKAFSEKYKDDALLAKTIRKGFPDEGMPAFGKDQISENQIKDLILYIRSFTPNK